MGNADCTGNLHEELTEINVTHLISEPHILHVKRANFNKSFFLNECAISKAYQPNIRIEFTT